jgi:hypothetical protein
VYVFLAAGTSLAAMALFVGLVLHFWRQALSDVLAKRYQTLHSGSSKKFGKLASDSKASVRFSISNGYQR